MISQLCSSTQMSSKKRKEPIEARAAPTAKKARNAKRNSSSKVIPFTEEEEDKKVPPPTSEVPESQKEEEVSEDEGSDFDSSSDDEFKEFNEEDRIFFDQKSEKVEEGDERGVIYIGRIPHGFYEEQMRGFFEQFGEITRLRLSRNKKVNLKLS
jgi:nucleolar protein 15